jgi:hypothetical protein
MAGLVPAMTEALSPRGAEGGDEFAPIREKIRFSPMRDFLEAV